MLCCLYCCILFFLLIQFSLIVIELLADQKLYVSALSLLADQIQTLCYRVYIILFTNWKLSCLLRCLPAVTCSLGSFVPSSLRLLGHGFF